ncbi:secondary thiamine-phosphate synthase enzyme [Luteitalea pratensis]|uniref:Secondary thiamine-phosphate synthase enzyme n=1 Tax=Luteitalea pratensis TaxID=1855912 RepID=A0A143PJI2_LUTPR|nr:secondary thiamine-phosphate synthase enzyme YjbQ [Luteitalea pratensis]AMY08725.1 secondary thiamine-phosphate synthase enzyme [Luteitalea pratensis]
MSPTAFAPAHPPAGIVRTIDSNGPYMRLRLTTSAECEVIDLTDQLEEFLELTGLLRGVLIVHTLHTTTAVIINEREPLLHGDLFRQLERLAPRELAYDHDDPIRRVVNRTDTERTNGHAHCRAMLLGSTLSLPIIDGRLVLGRWQRVLFVELDGPQERTVVATVVGGER